MINQCILYFIGNKFLSTKANSKDLLDMVQGLIPPMTYESYKGQAGRIAVIGGCKEYVLFYFLVHLDFVKAFIRL